MRCREPMSVRRVVEFAVWLKGGRICSGGSPSQLAEARFSPSKKPTHRVIDEGAAI
jgi:hypothetical protein